MSDYLRTITREHRSAYILLLDISGSMQDSITYEGEYTTKGESMVDAANKILQELYLRAFRDNEIRNYYDVAVICYSGRGVYSVLHEDGVCDSPFVAINEINEERCLSLKCLTPLNYFDNDQSSNVLIIPNGSTPMNEALYVVSQALKEWCARPDNFESAPPMVFHITDGHATDGDLRDMIDSAEEVMSHSTNYGDVLMLNIHLNPTLESQTMIFPTEAELDDHPSPFFRALGRASSPMPAAFVPLIREMRECRDGEIYRGVGLNVSVVDMISMMNIGTLSVPVN